MAHPLVSPEPQTLSYLGPDLDTVRLFFRRTHSMELCTRAQPKATPRRSWVPFQPTLLLGVIGLGDRHASGCQSFLGEPHPLQPVVCFPLTCPQVSPTWLAACGPSLLVFIALLCSAIFYFFNKTTTVYFSILVLMGICVAETKNDLIPSDYVFSWLLGAQA